jgi:hypothetical protein
VLVSGGPVDEPLSGMSNKVFAKINGNLVFAGLKSG